MRTVLIALLLVACHREVKSDLHLDEKEQDNSTKTTEETRAETKSQAPSEVKTKTTKSDNALIVKRAKGGSSVVRVPKDKPLELEPGDTIIGTVPLSQVLVDEDKSIGSVVTQKDGSKKSTEMDAKSKTLVGELEGETTSDVGFSLKFYLLAGGILAAIVALAVFLAHSSVVRHILGEP